MLKIVYIIQTESINAGDSSMHSAVFQTRKLSGLEKGPSSFSNRVWFCLVTVGPQQWQILWKLRCQGPIPRVCVIAPAASGGRQKFHAAVLTHSMSSEGVRVGCVCTSGYFQFLFVRTYARQAVEYDCTSVECVLWMHSRNYYNY